jgi:hypothetical protein
MLTEVPGPMWRGYLVTKDATSRLATQQHLALLLLPIVHKLQCTHEERARLEKSQIFSGQLDQHTSLAIRSTYLGSVQSINSCLLQLVAR